MSHERRSAPIRIAGLLLLLLFFTGQSAAAAADTRSDTPPTSAWVRAGARSLSARLLPVPECGPAALPLAFAGLAHPGTVVRVRSGHAPCVRAPSSIQTAVPLPRGPPFPA